MSEWISVEERVPPIREEDNDCTADVLAFNEARNMLAAFYSYEDAEWYDMNGDMILEVTHWMPLPAPPSTPC
ncbi:MAG: hypothetical protein CVV19_00620 [Gammaproteobacteria bacterium HGW-Gammaproteobacteria-9]|jgi:hypothetical protein|nr:MAG: hypothetical protein CVV19_00620 [Gammaproteobacteria bacterium HGW-Gammaproteobacteria-9]